MNNLRKAFRIATVDNEESHELITQLQAVQNETFFRAKADDVIAGRTEAKLSLEQARPTDSALSFHAADEEKEGKEQGQERVARPDQSVAGKTLGGRGIDGEAE